MSSFVLVRGIIRRWWWRSFHPLVRIGWTGARVGVRTGNHNLTNIGLALIAAGFASRFLGKREHLYTGGLEPGQKMRIVVERRGVRTERLVEG